MVLLGSAVVWSAISGLAQIRVTGKVVDAETGEALPGVTLVTHKGGKTVSDGDGKYRLLVPKGDTLHVSYVGFAPQAIPYNNLMPNQLIRLRSGLLLNEVTVTASIASVRNAKAIGADVDHLEVAKVLDKTSASSLAEILDGRISGVQLYQSNGKVGMPIRFNMRSGATLSMERDPIIYVDGVRYNNSHTSDINSSQDALSSLNDLAMEDIEHIDVIKGPAAASSYGAEAANGVVVITTKRGSQAQKGKIDVNVKLSHGFSKLARKYHQFVNNDAINNFFETGHQTNLYANLSTAFGKGNQVYLSLNENQTTGIVPGNEDKRHTVRLAYDLHSGAFSLGANMSYVNGTIRIPQTAQGRYDAIWNLMRTQEPWQYISERSWRAQSWSYANNRVIGGIQIGYLFPYGIKFDTNLGMDMNFVKGTYLLPYGYLVGSNDQGQKNVSNRRNENLTWDAKINKQFDLGNRWKLTATLLSQIVRRKEETDKINVSRFITDVDLVAAGTTKDVEETSFEQRTWGLYGELFLNYDNRLFMNAGLRRDASNLIGANVASIYYPSLSLSYNFRNLKLRGAYGESGRLPYPEDARTFYTVISKSAYGPYIAPSSVGNPDIRPERMREIEIGADWKVRNHQISLTGYAQHTSDAIIYQELKPSLGKIGTAPVNVGKVKGYGIELSWNGTLWSTREGHRLDMFATLNYQTNEVIDTGKGDLENLPNILKAGLPAYAFYEKRIEGALYDTNGVYKGAKEAAEMSYLGKPFPDVNGAIGADLTLFKYFTLSAKLSYAFGASIYNQSFYNVAGLGDNLKHRTELQNRLKQLTPLTDDYRNIAEQLAFTERKRANYIESADFVRLSSLSVGYDFTAPVRRFTHDVLKTCKLTLSGQNIALWTNYGGAEPQIEGNGGTRQTRRVGSLSRDITNAPSPRTFVMTLLLSY